MPSTQPHRTRHTQRSRRRWFTAAHVAAGAVLCVGTYLPWLYSGERGMSVYDLRHAADRLELVDDMWIVTPVVAVPLVLALALLARWAGRATVAAVLAVIAAVYTGAGALVASTWSVPTGAGLVLAPIGAVLVLATVAAEWLGPRLLSARGRGGSLT